jgi:hypothetical protein
MKPLSRCWWILVLAACGDDSANQPAADSSIADVAIPAPTCIMSNSGAIPPCDFSCVGTAWPTTAPEPVVFSGTTDDPLMGVVPGVQVEVRATADDALLGMGTSRTTQGGPTQPVGLYAISVASGGTAPTVYRKGTVADHVEGYAYDPTPTFEAARIQVPAISPANFGSIYQAAGLTADPSLGTVEIYVRDCAGNNVVNATVEVPGAARVMYEDANTLTLVSPLTTYTGVHGTAFAVAVPPGPIDITVRAGELTYRAWPIKVVAGAFTASTRLP